MGRPDEGVRERGPETPADLGPVADVVVVGAYTRDLYMFGERLPRTGETVNCREFVESDGGKGANQAVAAARLGAQVALVTGLGRDAAGGRAAQLFEREGIDTSCVVWDDREPTGAGFIVVDDAGDQILTTFAGASGRITSADVIRARPLIERAKVLIVQGELPIGVSLEAIAMAGPSTSVVVDPSPAETWIGCDMAGVHVLAPNEHEAALLAGRPDASAEDLAIATGVPCVVLHRGAAGVEVYSDGKKSFVPAVPAPHVVDTTGAGDAFCGALSAGLAQDLDLLAAVRLGTQAAAISGSRRYCIPSYPRRFELDKRT